MPTSLTDYAAQCRALALALDVRCPDLRHWHARPRVPCTPPDADHPDGWVCLDRIEFEVSTRNARRLAAEERYRRQKARAEREEREHRRSRQRARIATRIHEAAQR